MAGGRPTEYCQAQEDLAWEYANGAWEKQGDTVPSVVGLCKYINRARSIIYDWSADEDKQFSDILCTIKENQESQLIKNGLNSEFNPTITKLMLTKHGYSDRVESTHNLTNLSQEEWLDSLEDD
ncbi:MAG: terminase small subunit [Nitrosomonadaceae bacterium]